MTGINNNNSDVVRDIILDVVLDCYGANFNPLPMLRAVYPQFCWTFVKGRTWRDPEPVGEIVIQVADEETRIACGGNYVVGELVAGIERDIQEG